VARDDALTQLAILLASSTVSDQIVYHLHHHALRFGEFLQALIGALYLLVGELLRLPGTFLRLRQLLNGFGENDLSSKQTPVLIGETQMVRDEKVHELFEAIHPRVVISVLLGALHRLSMT
jgi:hypothetical protein